MSPDLLPPVAPSVTAELVEALSPRLRKRLDAGVAKLTARPVVREGDTVRIAVDDDTDLELHAPGGSVTRADAIRCGCLLAPDCLHRAAAASAAPVADDAPDALPAPAPRPARQERTGKAGKAEEEVEEGRRGRRRRLDGRVRHDQGTRKDARRLAPPKPPHRLDP